jgi:hypothetical protein
MTKEESSLDKILFISFIVVWAILFSFGYKSFIDKHTNTISDFCHSIGATGWDKEIFLNEGACYFSDGTYVNFRKMKNDTRIYLERRDENETAELENP